MTSATGRTGRLDVIHVGALLTAGLVLAWPVISGGFRFYIDNPVHLAELAEMAGGHDDWSDIGFTGFPIGTLHSPLWYPLLASLVAVGLPAEPLYAAALFVGFMTPSLALYAVARQHTAPLAALVVAFLILVQPPWLRGVGSPLAGMWTHALAVGLVALLAELLGRPRLDAGRLLALSVIVALAGLTHLFSIVAAVVLFVVTTWFSASSALDAAEVRRRSAAAALGALASSAYWLTFLWTTRPEMAPWDVLTVPQLATRLVLPADVLYLLDGRIADSIRWDLWLTDALPMLALLAMGVIGSAWAPARGHRLARCGRGLALTFLLALCLHAFVKLPFLGPVSWRHLDWVRLGAGLAAIPVADRLCRRVPRALAVTLPGLLALSALWFGKPLRNDRPKATVAELQAIEQTWEWIREHHDASWGRLYILDTFGRRWEEGGLSHSHLLSLTQRRTGAPQLGVYYGVVPYKTRWTLSEFNNLFSSRTLDPGGLIVQMGKTNSRAILTTTQRAADWLSKAEGFEPRYREGRYGVWVLTEGQSEWIAPLSPSNRIDDVEWKPGLVRFTLTTTRDRARVVAKTSWHPWWRLEGPAGAELVETPDGFLGIIDLPSGTHRLTLAYQPSPWPTRLSVLGWTLIAGWGIWLLRGRAARKQDARGDDQQAA